MARKRSKSAHKPASTEAPTPPQQATACHHAPMAGSEDTGRIPALCGAVGLLVLAGLHFGWRVGPALRYQQAAPPFFVDAPFFDKFSSVPGGLLDYAGAALAQLNFHNWLGAAAFIVLLGCIFLCARYLVASIAGAGATAAAGGLVALLAALPGRYESEFEKTALGILVSLTAASIWLAVPSRWGIWRLVWSWTLAAAVFYIGGVMSVALFVIVVFLNELVARRQLWLALGCLPGGLVVPMWAWHHAGFDPFAAVRQWGNGLTLTLHALAFLIVPAWITARTALARWSGGIDRPGVRRSFTVAGAIAILALWGWGLDASQKAQAQWEQAVRRQEWDRALSLARRLRAWPARARLQLTRALFHAGRLPEDLFKFPQRRGLDLLPGYEAGLAMARAEAQTLLELGQVNLAEHMAHESLELEGAKPDTLRLLARINIVKGFPEAARVFLNRLRLAPFHRREADRELALLDADPAGLNRPDLRAIRTRLPHTDEPDSGLPTEGLLRQLLKANPSNRMALDFLLTHQLLSTQLEDLLRDLRGLDAFDDPVLPRPCEEAILFYQYRVAATPADLGGRRVSPATIERYRRFADVARRFTGPEPTARAALAREFGDTFWFFALFGETEPVTTAAGQSLLP